MKQYFTTVKMLFKNMFWFGKGKKNNTAVIMIVSLAVLYLFIESGAILGVINIAPVFAALNIINELIAILFAVAAIVIVIFGIVAMLSFLYFSRDTEFFLSLPMKPAAVFAAKFTVIYITELALSVALLLPAFIALGVVTGASAVFYPVITVGILLAPSIPLVLGSILAIPLMYLVGFFKNKGALTSIVVIVLFGGVFALYYGILLQFQTNAGADADKLDPLAAVLALQGMFASIANTVYPYLALARLANLTPVGNFGSVGSAFINFGLSFGVIVLLIAVAIVISSQVYARGAAAQLESAKHKSTGKEKFVESSAFKTLLKKEWKTIIRTPSFAYSCLMIVFLAPILVFFMGSSLGQDIVTDMDGNAIPGFSYLIFLGIMTMFFGTNIAAATPFTREGKNFYALKTLPVDVKTHIKVKGTLNFIITAAAIFISSIVVLVRDFNLLYWFAAVAISTVYAYGYNSAAMLLDLKKPKLDWTTPNEAMKNNFNAVVPMLLNMACGIILLGGGVVLVLFVPGILGILSVFGLFGIAAAVMASVFPHLLNKNCERYFDRIE